MAARIFYAGNWTPTLTNDTTAMADNTYQALQGGASTQIINVVDIYISGMAGTAAPMSLVLARSSTKATTPAALAAPNSDGPMNPNATALVAGSTVVAYATSAAGPQRSVSVSIARLNLGVNAFGGAYRWTASPLQKWQIIGSSASAGESTLSALNFGTAGAINSSITYEPE